MYPFLQGPFLPVAGFAVSCLQMLEEAKEECFFRGHALFYNSQSVAPGNDLTHNLTLVHPYFPRRSNNSDRIAAGFYQNWSLHLQFSARN
jgi:hypothetical protein